MNLKTLIRIALAAIFLGQMVYISFYLPQAALSKEDFPLDLKHAFIVAGLALGGLWVIKKLEPKPPPQEQEPEAKPEDLK